MDEVGLVLDEAIKESLGISNKKWALALIALVVGAIGARWLLGRRRRTEGVQDPAEIVPA